MAQALQRRVSEAGVAKVTEANVTGSPSLVKFAPACYLILLWDLWRPGVGGEGDVWAQGRHKGVIISWEVREIAVIVFLFEEHLLIVR